jgi:hypothetical protein
MFPLFAASKSANSAEQSLWSLGIISMANLPLLDFKQKLHIYWRCKGTRQKAEFVERVPEANSRIQNSRREQPIF